MLPMDPDTMRQMLPPGCTICGDAQFAYNEVLSTDLIDEWQLVPAEVDYINLQQSLCCAGCGGKLRSMALAASLSAAFGHVGTLEEYVASPAGPFDQAERDQ